MGHSACPRPLDVVRRNVEHRQSEDLAVSKPVIDRRGTLIVVSNRLPYNIPETDTGQPPKRNVGGLVNALEPALSETKGCWVGWDGITLKSKEAVAASLAHPRKMHTESGVELCGVPLSDTEMARYYHSLSNRALWPLFHNLICKTAYNNDDWSYYEQVNRRFAETTLARTEPGDRIWVHDYHLMLVPTMLREMGFEGRIDYFLHIPFPALEMFFSLPWREKLVEGLLGADAVAFHVQNYRDNFTRVVDRLLDVRTSAPNELNEVAIEHLSRTTLATVAPIGIDVEDFERIAELESVAKKVQKLRRAHAGRKLIFGADRLDYTKGIIERLLAFERFLSLHPERAGTFDMLQVVVPSRSQVQEYRISKEEIDRHVGRINGAYGREGWAPIHYEYRALDREDLVVRYRAADVALITPLRDGMNLVAPEFVASRTDNDGVLVLSEFAGVAERLTAALCINPYDLDGTADAIARALDMPLAERQDRIIKLRRLVDENSVSEWAEQCLGIGYGYKRSKIGRLGLRERPHGEVTVGPATGQR